MEVSQNENYVILSSVFKGVLHLDLIFEDFVYFSKKNNFGQSIQWIWLKMFKKLKNHSFIAVETMVVKLL